MKDLFTYSPLLLLAACSVARNISSSSREVPGGYHQISQSGARGVPLSDVEASAVQAANDYCNAPYRLHGKRINSHSLKMKSAPANDSASQHEVILTIECIS